MHSFSLLSALLVTGVVQAGDRGVGTIWPQPLTVQPSSSIYKLTTNTEFTSTQSKCFILQHALLRTKRVVLRSSLLSDVLPKANKKETPFKWVHTSRRESVKMWMIEEPEASKLEAPALLTAVQVSLNHACDETVKPMVPKYEMNESYAITFRDSRALINAEEVWGALYALETFSQMVYRSTEGSWLVNGTTIKDSPAFKHRGTLLDTSRHYLPKSFLYKHLEAMSMNKMNVFHWHLVDDQSFPYQSYTFPDLSLKGSYRVDSYHTYSQQDIADVIEFARRRGIRVIPEFDTPGHTQSWGLGQKGLLTECYSKGKPTGLYGPIDPSKDSSYSFLSSFFAEITRVFPEPYIHLGGDEVPFDCWKSNPGITNFMKAKGFGTNYSKLEEFYEQSLINLVSKASPPEKNASYVVWQEIIDNNVTVPKDTLVHVWKDYARTHQQEMLFVTAKGYQVLLSACWYLNYISLGDWPNFYKCDPLAFNGTAKQKALVVGGEACQWGEYVDSSVSISRFWPRGSAVAERLWSKKDNWDPTANSDRLEGHRCRMLSRGMHVEPVVGPGYCSFGQEHLPDDVY